MESDYAALSRKELQQLAKAHGIKANMKNTEMIKELAALSLPAATDSDKQGVGLNHRLDASVQYLMKVSDYQFARLCASAGLAKVDLDVVEAARGTINRMIIHLVRDSVAFTDIAKRQIIDTQDVLQAITRCKVIVCASSCAPVLCPAKYTELLPFFALRPFISSPGAQTEKTRENQGFNFGDEPAEGAAMSDAEGAAASDAALSKRHPRAALAECIGPSCRRDAMQILDDYSPSHDALAAVLMQAHPGGCIDVAAQSAAVQHVRTMLCDIGSTAVLLAMQGVNMLCTGSTQSHADESCPVVDITSRLLEKAVRLCLPEELGKYAASESAKSAASFMAATSRLSSDEAESGGEGNPEDARSAMAGLHFDVAGVDAALFNIACGGRYLRPRYAQGGGRVCAAADLPPGIEVTLRAEPAWSSGDCGPEDEAECSAEARHRNGIGTATVLQGGKPVRLVRIDAVAAVCLAAVAEYMLAEILQLAGCTARNHRPGADAIEVQDLEDSIGNDSELSCYFQQRHGTVCAGSCLAVSRRFGIAGGSCVRLLGLTARQLSEALEAEDTAGIQAAALGLAEADEEASDLAACGGGVWHGGGALAGKKVMYLARADFEAAAKDAGASSTGSVTSAGAWRIARRAGAAMAETEGIVPAMESVVGAIVGAILVAANAGACEAATATPAREPRKRTRQDDHASVIMRAQVVSAGRSAVGCSLLSQRNMAPNEEDAIEEEFQDQLILRPGLDEEGGDSCSGLSQIHRAQLSTGLMLSKLAFQRKAMALMSPAASRISRPALGALQALVEVALVQVTHDAVKCARHRGSWTLTAADFEVALQAAAGGVGACVAHEEPAAGPWEFCKCGYVSDGAAASAAVAAAAAAATAAAAAAAAGGAAGGKGAQDGSGAVMGDGAGQGAGVGAAGAKAAVPLVVFLMSGDKIALTVDLKATRTVGELKQCIARVHDTPVSMQALFAKGGGESGDGDDEQPLANAATLSELGIGADGGPSLFLLPRPAWVLEVVDRRQHDYGDDDEEFENTRYSAGDAEDHALPDAIHAELESALAHDAGIVGSVLTFDPANVDEWHGEANAVPRWPAGVRARLATQQLGALTGIAGIAVADLCIDAAVFELAVRAAMQSVAGGRVALDRTAAQVLQVYVESQVRLQMQAARALEESRSGGGCVSLADVILACDLKREDQADPVSYRSGRGYPRW
jgi:histone H3/H4